MARRKRVNGDESLQQSASETEHVERTEEREPKLDDNRPRPSVAWGNVITDTLKVSDPSGVARRLRRELIIEGDGIHSYGQVLESLNRSASNMDDAGRLLRAARVEEDRFNSQCLERIEVLRTSALNELMEEYHKKLRRSPTNDDIEGRIMKNWPDEYKTIKHRQSEMHQAVRSLETLCSAWSSRCADLRIMADKVRQR